MSPTQSPSLGSERKQNGSGDSHLSSDRSINWRSTLLLKYEFLG